MSTRKMLGGFAVLMLLGSFVGLGCNRNATGRVRLLITDKPFPVDMIESAVVTITKIELRRSGGDAGDDQDDSDENENVNDNSSGESQSGDGAADTGGTGDQTVVSQSLRRSTQQADGEEEEEDDDGHGPFIVVYEGEQSYDLKELHNGYTAVMGEAEVPAGRYTQMRLHTPGGEVVLTDGRVFPLKVPSGASSGIKLHVTFEIPEDEETVLLLHVDLSRAFSPIPAGHIEDVSTIRNFKFHPSLAMRLIDLAEAGTISGTVTDEQGAGLSDAWVTAYLNGEEQAGTASDDSGQYRLIGLPPGNYTVEFSKNGFEDHTASDVVVEEGTETSGVDAQLTAVAPAEDPAAEPAEE